MRIMIVDHHPEILGLFKLMIELLGFEVMPLSACREVAARIETQGFDAILLDAGAPDLSGIELTKLIRSSPLNSKVPIVMLTNCEDIQTMRSGSKAGVSSFLVMPFSLGQMRALLNAMAGPMLTRRRKLTRLPIETTVKCISTLIPTKQFLATSVNIGKGGMAFDSSTSVEVGQVLRLEFYLPARAWPLQLLAKVLWMTPPNRYGIEFIQPSDSDRKAIQQYVIGTAQEQAD